MTHYFFFNSNFKSLKSRKSLKSIKSGVSETKLRRTHGVAEAGFDDPGGEAVDADVHWCTLRSEGLDHPE